MSPILGAIRGKRQYVRRFDHEEAKQRYGVGESVAGMAREYGVSASAVWAAVSEGTRENMRRQAAKLKGAGVCDRCGGTMSLAARRYLGSRLCMSCSADDRTTSVRETELRCKTCGEWKLDDGFARNRGGVQRRRGRHDQCRKCGTKARQDYRERHKVPCIGCGKPALPPSEKGPKGVAFPRCRECSYAGVQPEQAASSDGEATSTTESAEASA